MNGLLRVDAKELVAVANKMQEEIKKLHDAFKKIDRIVSNSQKYWQGEASDNHISKRDAIRDEYMVVYKELAKEPSNLYKIAGVYEEVEAATTEISMSLPTDVIM